MNLFRDRISRMLPWLVVAIALGYVGVVGSLAVFQRRLIFLPDTSLPDARLGERSGAVALDIVTPDGLTLRCWYRRPRAADMPVVLFLHGNAGNIANRAYRLAQAADRGWGMLLVEYRGYGGNAGAPSEHGLLTDARAALATLRQMGVPRSRIVLWGESLGTGVAVQVAAESEVGATVLEAPFTSLSTLAQRKLPFVPVRLLLLDRFDSLARIGAVHSPVFVLAGGRDTLVPLAMSRDLLAAANDPKAMFVQPMADHNGLATPQAFDAVAAFLARWMPP